MIRVFAGWGLLMATIGLVGVLFFDFASPENVALFFGTASTMAAIAIVLWPTGWGRNLVAGARALPDGSPATVLLAIAIVLAAVGAVFGLWLALIAAGLGLVAIGGLLREARAQRAALRTERRAAAAHALWEARR